MCVPYDAHPPIAAIAGAAVDSEDLTLQANDGTKFAAFAARAEKPSGVGIVVMPDVRGLFSFYEELALRFAEAGHNAVTIDYFGRSAEIGKRSAEFEFMPHVLKTHPDTVSKDVGAAVAYLKSPAGGSCTSVFTVGFCFGGSSSWNQSAEGHGLAGAIGFYGHPGGSIQDMVNPGKPSGIVPTVQRVTNMKAPILALQAGADQMIKQSDTDAFKAALDKAGVPNEIKTYEGAPHSFFDRAFEQYAADSDDAWKRILAFVDKYKK